MTHWNNDSPFTSARSQRLSATDLPREYLSSSQTYFCTDENLERDNNSAKLTFLTEDGKAVTVWRTLLPSSSPSHSLDLPSYREKLGGTVVVLLCHGGYFAGGVFRNHKCVVHKTFRRYVTRKKQGGRQESHDKSGGGGGKSAGKQLRRYNEVKHREEVQELLENWSEYLAESSLVFIHAPGINRKMFFPVNTHSHQHRHQNHQPMSSEDDRIKSVPLTTNRPTFAEVSRVFHDLSFLEVNQISPSNLPLAQTKISLSLEKEKEVERERAYEMEKERCMMGGGARIVMPKPRARNGAKREVVAGEVC